MGFLRRLLGGGASTADKRRQGADGADVEGDTDAALEPAQLDDEERARELELARFDQERSDDLTRRQQRYAGWSWKPPAQGGEKRADDADGDR